MNIERNGAEPVGIVMKDLGKEYEISGLCNMQLPTPQMNALLCSGVLQAHMETFLRSLVWRTSPILTTTVEYGMPGQEILRLFTSVQTNIDFRHLRTSSNRDRWHDCAINATLLFQGPSGSMTGLALANYYNMLDPIAALYFGLTMPEDYLPVRTPGNCVADGSPLVTVWQSGVDRRFCYLAMWREADGAHLRLDGEPNRNVPRPESDEIQKYAGDDGVYDSRSTEHRNCRFLIACS